MPTLFLIAQVKRDEPELRQLQIQNPQANTKLLGSSQGDAEGVLQPHHDDAVRPLDIASTKARDSLDHRIC